MNGIVQLFDEFEHIKYAKLAVASKILYTKRPALIPMMDSVVQEYYKRAYPDYDWSWKCAPLAEQLMRHFRDDLLAAKPQLTALGAELEKEHRTLSLVRLLELLIWMETERQGYYR